MWKFTIIQFQQRKIHSIWVSYSLREEKRPDRKAGSFSAMECITCWSIFHILEAIIGHSIAVFYNLLFVFQLHLRYVQDSNPLLPTLCRKKIKCFFFWKKLLALLFFPPPQLVFSSFKTSAHQPLRVYDNFSISVYLCIFKTNCLWCFFFSGRVFSTLSLSFLKF